MNGIVPDYVNPDGTKKLIGDIIYFKDGNHRCGIEVKLGTVRLTRSEFNSWIVKADRKLWPNVFLGVGTQGILLLPWDEFRASYIGIVGVSRVEWSPTLIDEGYGPMKSVDVLCQHHSGGGFFKCASGPPRSTEMEELFIDALSKLIDS